MMVIPNRVRVVALIGALAFAAGLALALLAKPSQAQDSGAVSERFPVNFTLDASLCGGDIFEVTGTLHTVNQFTEQPDGTYHVNSHFNLAGVKGEVINPKTGEPTGKVYVIPSAGSAVENVVQSGQIVTGTVDINLVIGKGQLNDQVAFGRVHYIIDEGQIKVETVQGHTKCQPGNASPTPTASATATASASAKANAAAKVSTTDTAKPGTGGAPLAMGAAVLLVGAGLAARRLR